MGEAGMIEGKRRTCATAAGAAGRSGSARAALTGAAGRSGSARAALTGAAFVAALGAAVGCGGGRSGLTLRFADTIWDRPLRPPPTVEGTMVWGEGEVTEVSLDGGTIHIKMTRGAIPTGAQIGIFVPTPEEPGPHYLWDEARELRAADARVVAASADTCKAEIINATTNAPIAVGDKVIVRIP